MKRIFTIMTAMLFAVTMFAQTDNGERKLSREEQKALQAQIDSIQFADAAKAINDTAFTLEADRVVFRNGYRAYVLSRTNFVNVKDGQAVVQVAFNIPAAGPNGMGGVTVQGMISGYKVERTKRGDLYVTFNVLGSAISAQVFVTVYKGSSQASVDISPNFNSRRLTLEGHLLPLDQSFVIQGRTL